MELEKKLVFPNSGDVVTRCEKGCPHFFRMMRRIFQAVLSVGVYGEPTSYQYIKAIFYTNMEIA
jgi:hypothetical protein